MTSDSGARVAATDFSPGRKQRAHAEACAHRRNAGRSSQRLGARALGEAADRGGFRVVHVEDREQLRDLQHFLELAAEVA